MSKASPQKGDQSNSREIKKSYKRTADSLVHPINPTMTITVLPNHPNQKM